LYYDIVTETDASERQRYFNEETGLKANTTLQNITTVATGHQNAAQTHNISKINKTLGKVAKYQILATRHNKSELRILPSSEI
jgi:hypothetical protein